MIKGRRIVSLLVVVQFATAVTARAADEAQLWRCPYTQGGGCVPNPKTYGYYKTRWRKWPSEATEPTPAEPVPAPKPAQPESTPPATPDAQGGAGSEDLPPKQQRPPFQPNANPAEQQPNTTGQQPDAMQSTPADTESEPGLPPELKSDLPQPPDLEKLLPDDGSDDGPPQPPAREPNTIPEEDDPFKDDPLPSDPSSGKSGAMRRQSRPTSETGVRWRPDPRLKLVARSANSKSQVQLADAQTAPKSNSAPNTAVKPARQAANAMPAVSRSNPLRAQPVAAEPEGPVLPTPIADDEVVPTADWSPEVAKQPATGAWHTNPLRPTR